jgi:hypothetical protein
VAPGYVSSARGGPEDKRDRVVLSFEPRQQGSVTNIMGREKLNQHSAFVERALLIFNFTP